MNKDDDWTSIKSEENNDRLPAENCVEMFFPLDNFAAYQYYKLEVTAVRWGSQLQIAEFKLVGTPAFTLPTGLRTIEESTFEDITDMISVDAGSVTSVGANAFKGCSDLNRIRLSGNCTIDPDAFTGCGTVYIFAPAGGSTEAYCNAHENCVFVEE